MGSDRNEEDFISRCPLKICMQSASRFAPLLRMLASVTEITSLKRPAIWRRRTKMGSDLNEEDFIYRCPLKICRHSHSRFAPLLRKLVSVTKITSRKRASCWKESVAD
ncbi:hypothetical protein CDAR_614461 [Caerostris darwini]|uniref:Uncharacterized protein n=1 Tax=Caerostris darwini TaxID=1538125 RepID=A0AAV4NQX2_9ARAC|nr:hypothetical protein CDAR_614461 [Caerostris darwini]